MNNTSVLTTTTLSVLLITACGGGGNEPASTGSTTMAPAEGRTTTYAVDPGNSSIEWTGTMLGVKSHHGTLALSDGHFTLTGEQLTGGEFTADLKRIAPLDTNYAPDGSERGTRSMLIGHLSSPDFFAVDSFPTAHFKITRVDGNTATGELTVRGRTNTEQVKDIRISRTNSEANASGKLVFDRQNYGVAWASPMKDMVLSDQIEVDVHLTAKLN
ncbi:MAG: YceI family protein [Flavobacteriales bacterium]|nr:YceI family protein [Flavobacteriales bacterium]